MRQEPTTTPDPTLSRLHAASEALTAYRTELEQTVTRAGLAWPLRASGEANPRGMTIEAECLHDLKNLEMQPQLLARAMARRVPSLPQVCEQVLESLTKRRAILDYFDHAIDSMALRDHQKDRLHALIGDIERTLTDFAEIARDTAHPSASRAR